MPIYDFKCKYCKNSPTKELLVSFKETPLCEVCGYMLERLLSAPIGRVTGSQNPVKQ